MRLVKRSGLVVPFTTRTVGDVPPLTGTVEVLSAGQWYEHLAECRERSKDGKRTHRMMAELVAKHLKSWDFYGAESDTQPLPITPDTVLELPAAVFEQLDSIIEGTAGTVSGNG